MMVYKGNNPYTRAKDGNGFQGVRIKVIVDVKIPLNDSAGGLACLVWQGRCAGEDRSARGAGSREQNGMNEGDTSERPDIECVRRAASEAVQQGTYRGGYRVEVIRYQGAIREVIDSGYTWTVAWIAFRSATGSGISFSSFRRHCRTLGIGRSSDELSRRGPKSEPPPPKVKLRLPNGLPVFEHSPVPNRRAIYGDDDWS